MDKYLDKRFSKSQNTEKYSYILTNVADGADKGIGVIMVDMETGEAHNQVVFDEKEPEYIVDDVMGRVYFFPKKSSIRAIDLAE